VNTLNTLISLLFLVVNAVLVWYLRQFLLISIRYKEARAAEIKRRLQVEHKNELVIKQLIERNPDDTEKLKIQVKAMNDRHQRQIDYVIQDMFEHNK
jgi:hypothetical protein